MNIKVIASGSKGNCYLINDNKTTLLLDAGIPIKQIQIACDFGLSKIDGCLITHEHKDHSKAVHDLTKKAVDIYTSEGTIKECGLNGHRINVIKALEQIQIGTFKVLPFDVQHDAEEPLGFLIQSTETKEKLLYFIDTCYLKYKFKDLNYIMAECNYSIRTLKYNVSQGRTESALAKRIIKSHMSLETLIDILKVNDLSKVSQIYLIHTSSNNGDKKYFEKQIKKLTDSDVYVY